MKKAYWIGAAALGIALAGYFTTTSTAEQPAAAPSEGAALVKVQLPESLSERALIGKVAFDSVCAACHGENAAGKMGFGPPLIHKIYEPSHHGDMSFQIAVQNGVRAHHWPFGDMPPQSGLTQGDVEMIVAYVREVQRANGIN